MTNQRDALPPDNRLTDFDVAELARDPTSRYPFENGGYARV